MTVTIEKRALGPSSIGHAMRATNGYVLGPLITPHFRLHSAEDSLLQTSVWGRPTNGPVPPSTRPETPQTHPIGCFGVESFGVELAGEATVGRPCEPAGSPRFRWGATKTGSIRWVAVRDAVHVPSPGYSPSMSGHEDEFAEGARRVKQKGPADNSDARRESEARPTGEEQAARNRRDDPPA